MDDSRSKYLFKNTVIFTLGNFATKLISFFLVPLYTNILTTAEYGTVDLVVTICTIAVPLLTLNIMESVMRFNLDKNADKDGITKVGISVLFIGILVGVFLVPICSMSDKGTEIGILVYFYVVCSASSQVFLSDLRGKEMLAYYSVGNVINTLLIAIFNIIFLLVFHWGIKGYLLAYTLAYAIVAMYALIIGKGYKAIFATLDSKKMREMLKYSIVLIPNSFMWWIMNASDHIMVTTMIGVAANGVYAISYKLPTLISTLTGIFNQAWTYSAIRESGTNDEISYNNQVFRNMMSITFLIGMIIIFVSKPFLYFYVGKTYFAAWKYVPPLTVGIVYMTLGSFVGCSYVVQKDTKGILYSGVMGAVINIVLNFMVIPWIGIMGAALATCISYIAVFIYRLIDTKKYIPINIKNKAFICGTILLALLLLTAYIDSYARYVIQLFFIIVAFVIFSSTWMPILKTIYKKI